MSHKASRLPCLFAGAALALFGCARQTETAPYEVGDEFPPQANSPDRIAYAPGEMGEPGRVASVESYGDDCYRVEVEHDPDWECSEEQIQEIQSGDYPAAGGYDTDQPQAPAELNADVSLQVTDCEGLADLRRPAMLDHYQSQLYFSRRGILTDRCLSTTTYHWVDGEGNPVSSCADSGYGADAGMMAGSMGGTGGAGPVAYADESAGAEEYSTTNNQVTDVDEADFVKNDSGYIYVASSDGLRVVDAWPAADTREIAQVELPGEPRRLFLSGDRLVAYSRMNAPQTQYDYEYGYYDSGTECTYGYDCRYSSDGGSTVIVVFDVSDPTYPAELERYELSGAFVAARRVGPYVYTVVHYGGGPQRFPDLDLDLKLDADDPAELDSMYEELSAQIERAVDEVPACDLLPAIAQEQGSDPDDPEPCKHALAGAAAAGTSFLSLVTVDLDAVGSDAGHQPSSTLVATKPGFVYASADALYVAVDGLEGGDSWYGHSAAANDASVIHKFALDGARTSYVGGRGISGHVLNQFSMDEYEGVLRVATSNGWVPDPDVSSNVTTLAEVDGELVRLGQLTGLAPSEDIRSVRFDRERGFIVTFKKTDPLFVIDLSDPGQPSVLGELKIPGYSTYMHYLDEDHLLAVGFDADDHGSFAYFDGIQIQIFDVSELANPQLVHKTVIGTRGSGSEALMDHLAFNYFAPRGLLALPVTICEGGDDGSFGDRLTFSGLMVFDVSLQNGITERGRMPFVDANSAADYNYGSDPGCGQWWSNSTSLVKRSIFMDDYAYGISDTQLQVAALSDLGEILQSVPLVGP